MTRYRSAVTGRYVSREYAEENPDTTVAETDWRDDVPEAEEVPAAEGWGEM